MRNDTAARKLNFRDKQCFDLWACTMLFEVVSCFLFNCLRHAHQQEACNVSLHESNAAVSEMKVVDLLAAQEIHAAAAAADQALQAAALALAADAPTLVLVAVVQVLLNFKLLLFEEFFELAASRSCYRNGSNCCFQHLACLIWTRHELEVKLLIYLVDRSEQIFRILRSIFYFVVNF